MIALPPATEAVYHNGAPEGERNTQLFRMALQFRDQGLSQFDAESEAEIWGFKNGLTQNECVAAVKSAYSKPARVWLSERGDRAGGSAGTAYADQRREWAGR